MAPFADPAPQPFLSGKKVFCLCAAILLAFGVLSFTAVLHKSATYDEPLHLTGGFVHRYFHDYRINPEDPALFGLWATIPLNDLTMAVDLGAKSFRTAATDINQQWVFSIDTLYRTNGNDPDRLLRSSRVMFTFLGVALGALIARWSWKLAGGLGAIAATVLFALDPNFLAHASLVKNDVAMSLCLAGLGYATWQFGRRGGAGWGLLIGLICGAAVNTKFSGVLTVPIVAMLLLIRALIPRPWRVAGIDLHRLHRRLIAAGIVVFVSLFIVWLSTWATYGFRYAPMRDGGQWDFEQWVTFARTREMTADFIKQGQPARKPTREEFDADPMPSGIVQLDQMINAEHLLPEAWTFGFLYTYAMSQIRGSFLLGMQRDVGWWYYFPIAMLVKTPLATLAAMLIATLLLLARIVLPGLPAWKFPATPPLIETDDDRASVGSPQLDRWSFFCLLIPPAVYGLAAMTTNLNLGVRHILPVYPYIFIGIALLITAMFRLAPRATRGIVIVLAIGLAIESLSRWPDFLPFYNLAAGGLHGQRDLDLLADSNLDWGQDLIGLADWRKTHLDRPLLLSYFGTADPEYYGITYINLRGGKMFADEIRYETFPDPAYLAVSATNLQGVYLGKRAYAPLRSMQPIAMIGKSIYIYDWPGASAQ